MLYPLKISPRDPQLLLQRKPKTDYHSLRGFCLGWMTDRVVYNTTRILLCFERVHEQNSSSGWRKYREGCLRNSSYSRLLLLSSPFVFSTPHCMATVIVSASASPHFDPEHNSRSCLHRVFQFGLLHVLTFLQMMVSFDCVCSHHLCNFW